MKKRTFPWQRVLIGLLLILNAIPFSLDITNRHFIVGLLFAVSGLIVTFFPSVPDDDFSFWDLVSVIIAAIFAATVIIFFNKIPPLAVVLFAAGAIIFFFIPRRLKIRRFLVALSAHDLLYDLESAKIISKEEHKSMSAELLARTKINEIEKPCSSVAESYTPNYSVVPPPDIVIQTNSSATTEVTPEPKERIEHYFKVAGVTFRNPDGTSRQKILKEICMDEDFGIEDAYLEEYKYKGEDAIRVLTSYGCVGNIKRDDIEEVKPLFDIEVERCYIDIDSFENEDEETIYYAELVIVPAQQEEVLN